MRPTDAHAMAMRDPAGTRRRRDGTGPRRDGTGRDGTADVARDRSDPGTVLRSDGFMI
jgi:hypothetical protein